MKKFLAWILLSCTLLLAACDSAQTASDTSIDQNSSAEFSSDASSDSSKFRHTLISVGKLYTVNAPADDAYPDLFGQQITDGQKTGDAGIQYTDIRMVGYTGNTMFDIDLGEDGKRISGVSVRCLDMDKDGVKLAASYRVYGSDDGETGWKPLGKMNFTPSGNQTVCTASLFFDELYNYRYIRISVVKQGGFFFVDELEVYADVEEKEEASDGALQLYQSESIDRDAWKALSTGTSVSPVYSTNVALYKSYRFDDCTFDGRAPQNDTYLTDGARTGRLFGDTVWVGMQASGVPSITLDLGEMRNDLYAFRLHMLGSGLQVSLPRAIDVYGSADGKAYTLLGRIYAPSSCDTHAYTLILSEYIEARYLKFAFATGENACWIEEIEVMAGLPASPEEELYPPLDLPYVKEDALWSETDADYTQTQNLIHGLTQQIAATAYSTPAELNPDEIKESDWNCPVLTDGRHAQNMYCYGGEWFYASGDSVLDFFYDLGKLSTVESLHISLLEQTKWGISRPKFMSVFLSDDGENWYKVYDYDRPDDTSSFHEDATRLPFDCELETPYAARFVRFRIEAAMLFIDELQVMGTKTVEGSARLQDSGINSVIYYTNPEREQYANSDNTTVKASDIACVYGDYGNEAMLKAYVAYLDEDGNAVDTLMDGFLYGTSGSVPSKSAVHLQNYKEDWEFNFDMIFNGSAGFDKLNQVVGEVKEELNKPEHQVYVYITMWSVPDHITDFGDVDGDGVSENLSVASERKKVVNWFTEMCMTEFASRGYEHIVLDGFYWQSESISWEDDNSALVKEVSDYIHEANTNFLWIPYYTANRYHLGYELGFDLVCMQPNYMFDLEKPLYRFTVTASRTKRQHMCVEIEHTGQAMSDPLYARNYMLYLYYGALTGYMNEATHIYYNDLDNFAQMAYSDDPMHRMQYDATYRFIEGTLAITPETKETLKLTAGKNTVLEDVLNTDGSLSLYTLVSAPESGYVTLSSDGTFRYFPDKGFTGTDTFTYTYNNYLGESEICTVEITVD